MTKTALRQTLEALLVIRSELDHVMARAEHTSPAAEMGIDCALDALTDAIAEIRDELERLAGDA